MTIHEKLDYIMNKGIKEGSYYKEFVAGNTYGNTSAIMYKADGGIIIRRNNNIDIVGEYIKITYTSNYIAIVNALQDCSIHYIDYNSTSLTVKDLVVNETLNLTDGPYFIGVK